MERFGIHFAGPDGSRKQGVLDDRVIALCNQHGWVLITTDCDIIRAHRKEIRAAARLGVLATSHNSEKDIMVWARSLVQIKPDFDRHSFRKRQKPWYGQFNRQGKITSIYSVE